MLRWLTSSRLQILCYNGCTERMKKIFLLLHLFLYLTYSQAQVRDAFNNSRQNVGGNNKSAFNQSRVANFNDYRQKLNVEYIKMGSVAIVRG